MGLMARFARWLGIVVVTLVAGFASAVVLTARPGDARLYPSPPGTPTVGAFLVSHGFHSGIVLPRAELAEVASRNGDRALIAAAARFAAYQSIEFGWGDEGFYRNVPTAASLTVSLAARALLMPGNPSVLHLVGLQNHPVATFPRSDIIRLELSTAGFERLLAALNRTFVDEPDGLRDLGPGLYGPSRFFRAAGTFHLFRVCNHWVADLLDAAGVPTTPVLATLPQGLFLDLRWRSGLEPLPRPGA